MVWNAENRLERVEDSAEGWKETYVYDADGGRVAKKYWNGSTTSTTLYVNGMWERDIDNGVDTIQLSHAGRYVASYTKGPGTSTDLQWHFTDHLGSPVASGDPDVLAAGGGRRTFLPFGAPNWEAAPFDSGEINFTGQRRDAATGLGFYNARYYDSEIGRFISADSIVPGITDATSFNRYAYVNNNPLKYTDPTGHEVVCVCFAVSTDAFAFTGTITVGTAWDGNGNYGTVVSVSYGVGFGVGASLGLGVQISSKDNLEDIAGFTNSVGGCAALIIGGCASVSLDGDSVAASFNIGFELKAEQKSTVTKVLMGEPKAGATIDAIWDAIAELAERTVKPKGVLSADTGYGVYFEEEGDYHRYSEAGLPSMSVVYSPTPPPPVYYAPPRFTHIDEGL
ncbi:MAG: RHS repeat-associated core domain-containing protein [Chloroflexi bacterium]|nr:RHS repeat-associated core domain-containing protein [Chloroflexota bacterium]